jgi:glycosyltransferase involved in cell wall biosynthesis|tara:strand:- start:84957 stop:86108 length:1152 start_codon:yes stop_codon:yes gene_type:complete
MLRVLTLSTLYPNPVQPGLGGFCARQTERLGARPDVEVQVIAPVAKFPLSLPGAPYSALRSVPVQEQRGGLTVHHPRFTNVPVVGWRWSAEAVARAVLPLARQLHAERPFDVVDCQFMFPDAVAAHQISRTLHIPYSLKARGSDIHFWGARTRARRQIIGAGRHANGILAVSSALKRDMSRFGLSRERIDVHYTGVELERFSPKAAPKAERPLLISVGNLVPLKRHDLLVDMMVHLPDVALEIIGEGPERHSIARRIERLKLGDRVRLLGRLPHDELPARLAAAHALVHASEREGLANVWMEAMASGTPVVTTNVGGAAEVVTPATGALLPKDSSAVAMAHAVQELLASPPDRAKIREAVLPFSWQANTDALYAHLARLSGRK